MLDKSWISLPRTHQLYRDGLNMFLDFAFMRASCRGKIVCPCPQCKFKDWQTRDVVFNHCIVKQFPPGYLYWKYHGEEGYRVYGDVGSSSQVGMHVQDEDEPLNVAVEVANPINDAVRDLFGVHEEGDEYGDEDDNRDVDGPAAEYLQNEAAKNFFDLMTDADTPLYPGQCHKLLLHIFA